MKEYKDTLNILNTNFEMKANLSVKEPLIQKQWIKDKIYQKIIKNNKNKPQKTLHDGPPYANGPIHCGHALNRILKDFIVRFDNLSGFYNFYIPG
jgi:isoleucyl-tRNA synthetase